MTVDGRTGPIARAVMECIKYDLSHDDPVLGTPFSWQAGNGWSGWLVESGAWRMGAYRRYVYSCLADERVKPPQRHHEPEAP